jgi:hypothetical protein
VTWWWVLGLGAWALAAWNSWAFLRRRQAARLLNRGPDAGLGILSPRDDAEPEALEPEGHGHPETVPCPWCGMPAGEACRDAAGGILPGAHPVRHKAAHAADREREFNGDVDQALRNVSGDGDR